MDSSQKEKKKTKKEEEISGFWGFWVLKAGLEASSQLT